MRVTIIGPAFPLRGGIAHHVYYLDRELAQRGHTVQIISFRKLYPKLLFPGSTVFDSSSAGLDPKATPILSSLNPISWAHAVRSIKAFSPDVILFQWWHSFFAPMIGSVARALRRQGARLVLECHNVFPHERSRFDTSLLKFAADPIDYFITHSRKDREDLQAVLPKKTVKVCPLPVPEEFAGGLNSDRAGQTILFFGTVRKYKGLDLLLEAMPKVLSQVGCRLLVAGEFYEPVEKYQALISRLKLDSHVSIDNRYIPNEELPEVFDQADVLVLPYRNATQSAVARIALSNALPVIASQTGGLAEVVKENENGLLFPANDADELADRLITYFTRGLGPKFAKNIKADSRPQTQEIAETIESIANDQT